VLEARDPDGRIWKVERRWAPERIRVRRGELVEAWPHALGILDDGSLTGMALFAAVIVLSALLVFVVLPIAALLLELLLFVALVAGYVGTRVVLRRPWEIEVCGEDVRRAVPVRGWRASRRAMRDIAAGLERGEALSVLLGTAAEA
jgi:hypothetical protein